MDASDPENSKEYFRDENFNLVDAEGNLVDESALNVINKTARFDPRADPF